MMGRRKAAIGVDIGGTKISAGIVGGEGLVYASPCTIATNPKEPGEVIISNLFSLLKNILADAADYDIQGIGIGCTGPLDIDKGILLDVENLPTLNYFPLKDTVEQVFPLRVILDNDANALIYAEALWGAGRNAGSVLGFTLGTGIGCAWINGGKYGVGIPVVLEKYGLHLIKKGYWKTMYPAMPSPVFIKNIQRRSCRLIV